MEILLAINTPSGNPSNIGITLKEISCYLQDKGIEYVFVGPLALGVFIRPRFTDKVQIVCDSAGSSQLDNDLKACAVKLNFHGSVEVFADTHPVFTYALKSRVKRIVFDAPLQFPSALALCWTLIEFGNEDIYSLWDAGRLIAEGAVQVNELWSLLERHPNARAFERLKEIESSIAKGGFDPDGYNKSVIRRLENRKNFCGPYISVARRHFLLCSDESVPTN